MRHAQELKARLTIEQKDDQINFSQLSDLIILALRISNMDPKDAEAYQKSKYCKGMKTW